jgi:hypothetical protein
MVTKGGGFTEDFYIKDEGYAAVKVVSNHAKLWCLENGFHNSLLEFGAEFCGQKVWTRGMKEGIYQFGIRRSQLAEFLLLVDEDKFTFESEL